MQDRPFHPPSVVPQVAGFRRATKQIKHLDKAIRFFSASWWHGSGSRVEAFMVPFRARAAEGFGIGVYGVGIYGTGSRGLRHRGACCDSCSLDLYQFV